MDLLHIVLAFNLVTSLGILASCYALHRSFDTTVDGSGLGRDCPVPHGNRGQGRSYQYRVQFLNAKRHHRLDKRLARTCGLKRPNHLRVNALSRNLQR